MESPPGPRAPSGFEERVYLAVRAIPPGFVTTYGAVARVAGGSPRSVGGCMRRNAPAVSGVP